MYDVELPVFRGPLDLLLHLIERQELDITSVSLVAVTDQYLAVIRSGELIEMDALADFIAIGSRLILLKSRALLPRPPAPGDDHESEDEDAEELVRLLEEYRRFKNVAEHLRERQQAGVRAFRRPPMPSPQLPLPLGLDNVTIEQLLALFRDALNREPEVEAVAVIEREVVTVAQKIEEILGMLQASTRVRFREVMQSCRRRLEIVVAFLAVLELVKDGRLVATQDSLYGDIDLSVAEAALV